MTICDRVTRPSRGGGTGGDRFRGSHLQGRGPRVRGACGFESKIAVACFSVGADERLICEICILPHATAQADLIDSTWQCSSGASRPSPAGLATPEI